jgi:hypothetical protein
MMSSLKSKSNTESKKISGAAPEVDQGADDNQGADIISHLLSVGAANEKPQSQNLNYKLSMEVCFIID